MRIFTALVPPPTALGAIEDFVAPRRDADPQVRFVGLDSWHVTTAFAASVLPGKLDRLCEALSGLADRFAPLDVTIGGAGCFPNPSRAKVLYLAAEPAEPLGRLAAASRQAATHAGVEVDGARFVPHLTVARLPRPIEATRWLRLLDACPPASWHAGELLLIESHVRDRANRYEVVERFPFRGRDHSPAEADQP